MEQVFLSRRNLLTLLNKLDRNKQVGEQSLCTIVKTDTVHSKYPCTSVIMVTAVEDEKYYTDRVPGQVKDAPDQQV